MELTVRSSYQGCTPALGTRSYTVVTFSYYRAAPARVTAHLNNAPHSAGVEVPRYFWYKWVGRPTQDPRQSGLTVKRPDRLYFYFFLCLFIYFVFSCTQHNEGTDRRGLAFSHWSLTAAWLLYHSHTLFFPHIITHHLFIGETKTRGEGNSMYVSCRILSYLPSGSLNFVNHKTMNRPPV